MIHAMFMWSQLYNRCQCILRKVTEIGRMLLVEVNRAD